MIDRQELIERAGELSLRPDVVEKDYVLGWVLAGIAAHSVLGSSWVFKGGTCLKKVYFETYRFSEDLDFTLAREEQLDEAFLTTALREVAEWVYEASGVEIPPDAIRVELYRNPRGRPSAQARLYYRGPLRPGGSLPAIRLDLTADERIVLDPVLAPVAHPYGDAPEQDIQVRSYAFVEVFAEKVRALGDRARPRDLYDVVNLFRRDETRALASGVDQALREKCAFKELPIPTLASLQPHRDELEGDWDQMLGHQLPELPPFLSFWGELPAFFDWLEGRVPRVAPPAYATRAGETVLRPPAGGFARLGVRGRPLETIRFAAASHLCADIEYADADGRRSVRRIEPYSLRRSEAGDVLLQAEQADGTGHRTFRVDRIQGARVSDQPFLPRWTIELSPAGMGPILRATRARSPGPGRVGSRRRSTRAGRPVYVYECTLCGKRFERTRQNARTRPHQDRLGLPCAGRTSVLVEMR